MLRNKDNKNPFHVLSLLDRLFCDRPRIKDCRYIERKYVTVMHFNEHLTVMKSSWLVLWI